jgi:hypothetical protein
MAKGLETYAGLAVPLFGESEIKQQRAAIDILTVTGATSQTGDFLVLEDVDGTEVFSITSSGYMKLTGTIVDSSTLGFFCNIASSSTVGTNVALQSQITVTKESGATQDYAGWFYLDSSSSTTPAVGGREAVLNLYYMTGTTSAHAGSGFVFFDDGGSNAQIAFNFGANTCTDGIIVTTFTDMIATAGIRCMFGTTVFYILCSSCNPA